MGQSLVKNYPHIIFSTEYRHLLINETVEDINYRFSQLQHYVKNSYQTLIVKALKGRYILTKGAVLRNTTEVIFA